MATVEQQTQSIVEVTTVAIGNTRELADQEKMDALVATLTPTVEAIETLEVTSQEAYNAAMAHMLAIKPKLNALEKGRKAINRTFTEKINSFFSPVLSLLNRGHSHCQSQVSAWDKKLADEARERQREEDEKARRSLQAQNAAVAQGKERRQEIAANEIERPSALAQNTRQTFRLEVESIRVESLPDEFVIKMADKGKIRAAMLEAEKGIAKDRRGMVDAPQPIYGVKFRWGVQYRTA